MAMKRAAWLVVTLPLFCCTENELTPPVEPSPVVVSWDVSAQGRLRNDQNGALGAHDCVIRVMPQVTGGDNLRRVEIQGGRVEGSFIDPRTGESGILDDPLSFTQSLVVSGQEHDLGTYEHPPGTLTVAIDYRVTDRGEAEIIRHTQDVPCDQYAWVIDTISAAAGTEERLPSYGLVGGSVAVFSATLQAPEGSGLVTMYSCEVRYNTDSAWQSAWVQPLSDYAITAGDWPLYFVGTLASGCWVRVWNWFQGAATEYEEVGSPYFATLAPNGPRLMRVIRGLYALK